MVADVKHIAIAIQNGIGDVVMSFPMLSAIDKSLPINAKLSLLVLNQGISGLLNLLNWRSNLSIIPLNYNGGWNYQTLFKTALRLRYLRPDIYLAVHSTNRPLPALFARLVGAKISVGPMGRWSTMGFNKKVPPPGDMHKVHYYSKFAKVAGLCDCKAGEVEICIPPKKIIEARRLLDNNRLSKKWIFLSPGSGPLEMHKRWPEKNYRNLILRLLRHSASFNVGLFGGPDELAAFSRISKVAADCPGRCKVFAQKDFPLSLSLLHQADCMVSGCSGPIHMAALAKVPIVALYGPTNHCSTGPFSDRVRFIRKDLQCSPCYRVDFRHGCKNPRCMKEISVEEVFNAVLKTIDGEPYPQWRPLKTTNAVECSLDSDVGLSQTGDEPNEGHRPLNSVY